MIKASNLRLGNLLIGEQGLIYSIIEINEVAASAKTSIDNAIMVECPFNVFAAIPLNEEWLQKLGFRNVNSDICFVKYSDEIDVEIEKVKDGYSLAVESFEYIVGKAFKHVHQLQNLFHALTGEELQIIK